MRTDESYMVSHFKLYSSVSLLNMAYTPCMSAVRGNVVLEKCFLFFTGHQIINKNLKTNKKRFFLYHSMFFATFAERKEMYKNGMAED